MMNKELVKELKSIIGGSFMFDLSAEAESVLNHSNTQLTRVVDNTVITYTNKTLGKRITIKNNDGVIKDEQLEAVQMNKITMIIDEIDESGGLNNFISSILSIEEDGKYYVCPLKNGQTVIFNTEDGKVVRLKNGQHFNSSKSYTWEERLVWQYNHTNPAKKLEKNKNAKVRSDTQSDLSIYNILPILEEIINAKGHTRNTYIGLEGNHIVPRDFEPDNSLSNLELTDSQSNKRHWAAWSKVQGLLGLSKKNRIKLSLSANDKDIIHGILHKNTCYLGNFDHDYRSGQFILVNPYNKIGIYQIGDIWNATII